MGTTHFRSKLRYAGPQRNTAIGQVPAFAGFAPGIDNYSNFVWYFNDFLRTSDLDSNDWTTTTVGAGSSAALSDDAFPGQLVLTTDAGATDAVQIQYTAAGGAGEFAKLAAGRCIYFETRLLLTDANNDADTVEQVGFFAGLAITDTTVVAGTTDYIGFAKLDGSGLINHVAGKNATTLANGTVTSTGKTLVAADANTWNKLGFLVEGLSTVYVFLNGVHVATQTTTTHLCDDEELCITLALLSGEAVAKIMHVDYVLCAVERG